MRDNSIVRGVFFLTLSGLFTRVIGAVYRVFLVRAVGAEGVGLIQMTLPMYSTGITLATAGLPAGLAKIFAEKAAYGDWRQANNALRATWHIVLPLVLATSILLVLAAPWLSQRLLSDERTYPALLVMPTAIIASSLSWVLRGYFQGQQNLVPTAAAQAVEQVVRVAAVLVLAVMLLPYGLAYAAAGVVIGMAVGELGGLLVMWVYYRRDAARVYSWKRSKTTHTAQTTNIRRELVTLSIPIMLHRLLGSVSSSIDVVLIPARLSLTGLTTQEATRLFGQFSGMAVPLLFLPTVFIFPLTTALMPIVSATASRRNIRLLHVRLLQAGLITLLVGCSSAFVFWTAPHFLGKLLYSDASIGPLIRSLAPLAPLIYLQFVLGTALNGLGYSSLTLGNHLAGVAAKFVFVYWLTALPQYGIMGAVIGETASALVTTLLHAHFLWQKIQPNAIAKS